MVAMYVNGQKIGTLEDAIRAIRDAAANNQSVEFREPDGQMIGKFLPRALGQTEPDHVVG